MTKYIQTASVTNKDKQHRQHSQPQAGRQGEASHTKSEVHLSQKFTLCPGFPTCFSLVGKKPQPNKKLTRIKFLQDFQNLPLPKPPQHTKAPPIQVYGKPEINFILEKLTRLGGSGEKLNFKGLGSLRAQSESLSALPGKYQHHTWDFNTTPSSALKSSLFESSFSRISLKQLYLSGVMIFTK